MGQEHQAAIVISNAPTAISKRRDPQRQLSALKSLTGLAEARQASVSAETLKLYSSKLSEFPEADVRAVCVEVADTPRREGETAFPERGKLVARLHEIADTRRRDLRSQQEREKQEEWFWQWVGVEIEDTGRLEQEILDSVKVAGFTGRKARNAV